MRRSEYPVPYEFPFTSPTALGASASGPRWCLCCPQSYGWVSKAPDGRLLEPWRPSVTQHPLPDGKLTISSIWKIMDALDCSAPRLGRESAHLRTQASALGGGAACRPGPWFLGRRNRPLEGGSGPKPGLRRVQLMPSGCIPSQVPPNSLRHAGYFCRRPGLSGGTGRPGQTSM